MKKVLINHKSLNIMIRLSKYCLNVQCLTLFIIKGMTSKCININGSSSNDKTKILLKKDKIKKCYFFSFIFLPLFI